MNCRKPSTPGLWKAMCRAAPFAQRSLSADARCSVCTRRQLQRFRLSKPRRRGKHQPKKSAPTTADFHDVNLEGKSGILATCGRDPRPRWVSSERRLEWPNAAVCVFFSGEEPESLRGPQCELCVIDEIARMRYQQQVFDAGALSIGGLSFFSPGCQGVRGSENSDRECAARPRLSKFFHLRC